MRTLKKTLALVLCLAMIAGLCCFGTSAAFADADKIEYTEAVEVMNVVGVLKGDGTNFNPKGILTRAEAAVMLAKLIGEGNVKSTSTFKDMAGYEWAQSFAAVCEDRGLIKGDGAGNFMPGDTLTGYQFGLMLIRALGYKPAEEGVQAATYEIGTAALMKKLGLSAVIKGFDGTKGITREQAAALLLQTMKTTMVEYANGGTTITGGGFTITTGSSAASTQKWGAIGTGYDYTTGTTTAAANETIELCEMYFPGLQLVAANGTTKFGRPSANWSYANPVTGITTAVAGVAVPAATYTTGVLASKIYADLGLTAASVTPTVKLNGASSSVNVGGTTLTKTGTNIIGGNGVVTEVYKTAPNTVTIIQTKYTLGVVANVVSYAATAAKGAYTTYTIDTVAVNGSNVYVDSTTPAVSGVVFSSVVDPTADLDTIKLNGTFAKGDYVLFVADAADTALVLGGFPYVYPVTTATGTLTASSATTYTIGGVAYPVANVTVAGGSASFATALYSTVAPVTVALDSYGNVIAPTQAAAAAPTYFYVVTSENAWSLNGTTLVPSVTATVVDAEGVAKTISVTKIGANAIDGVAGAGGYDAGDVGAGLYTYKLAKDGSTYELTTVSQAVDGSFDYKTGDLLATSPANIYGNDNTVFYVIKTASEGGKTVIKSITKTVGMAAMGDVNTAVGSYVANIQNVATHVFLTTSTAAGTAKVAYYNGVYSFDGTNWTYSVNCDAVATTVVDTTGMSAKGLYTINASNVASAVDTASGYLNGTATYTESGKTYGLIYNGGLLSVVETTVIDGTTSTDANVTTVAANVPVYTYVAATGACTAGTIADGVSGASLIYFAATLQNTIGAIYVVK